MKVFVVRLPLLAAAGIIAFAFVIASSIAPSVAFADCAVRSEEAYIPLPPPGADVAAAYFTLTNDCQSAATVIGVEADHTESSKGADRAGTISLHQSSTVHGIARMMPAKRIPLHPGSSVAFVPGGLHVMLHGQELRAGETFQFHLVLEDGNRVSVLADVVSGRTSAHRDHQNHGGHEDHKHPPAGDVE